MEWNKRFFLAVMVCLTLQSCSSGFATEKEFLRWLNEPRNGFLKTATTNGFLLSVKYLPSDYVIYTEMRKSQDLAARIEPKEFEDSMIFIFSIEHQFGGDVNATNYGINNMEEYKSRVAHLNFDLREYLFIKKANGNVVAPVLSVFENTYEIGGKNTFYVVFPKTQEMDEQEVLDVVFKDPFLDTGITHFVFQKNRINQIPILEFAN